MRPDNAGYYYAAYAAAVIIYLLYALSLFRRRARVRSLSQRLQPGQAEIASPDVRGGAPRERP